MRVSSTLHYTYKEERDDGAVRTQMAKTSGVMQAQSFAAAASSMGWTMVCFSFEENPPRSPKLPHLVSIQSLWAARHICIIPANLHLF